MDELIKQLLGESYCLDDELEELNYRGNPIAYWINDYEVRMVDLAKSILNKAAQADIRRGRFERSIVSGVFEICCTCFGSNII